MCGIAQVFAFKLLFVKKMVDMSKIQNEPLLSRSAVETEIGLMILGLQASSSIKTKRSKSLTTCETKSYVLTCKGVVSLDERSWKLKNEFYRVLNN